MRARYGRPRPAFQVHTIRDPEAPATERQIAVLRLQGKKKECGWGVEDIDPIINAWIADGTLTKGFASTMIDQWGSLPWRPRPERAQAGPGYYTLEGSLYVVVENRAKTRTYAKKLVEIDGRWQWDYESAKGVATRLAGAAPLTEEEAAKWGHLHGRCFKCLKPLTDPKSVKRGMGPVCAKALKR